MTVKLLLEEPILIAFFLFQGEGQVGRRNYSSSSFTLDCGLQRKSMKLALFSWSRDDQTSWLCSFWQVKKHTFPHDLLIYTKF
jgi:hypothetical protein